MSYELDRARELLASTVEQCEYQITARIRADKATSNALDDLIACERWAAAWKRAAKFFRRRWFHWFKEARKLGREVRTLRRRIRELENSNVVENESFVLPKPPKQCVRCGNTTAPRQIFCSACGEPLVT